jgi:hypothetical protein
MTLCHLDGFDHYSTADLQASLKASVISTPTIDSTGGRRGTGCMVTPSGARGFSKTFNNQQVWTVGFALNMGGTPGTVGNLITFLDSSTIQCCLCLDTTNHLRVYRGNQSTLLATSANTLAVGTWNYIEVKVTISNTVGAIEARVNGSSSGWINVSSIDNCSNSNEYANLIKVLGVTAASLSAGNFNVDDVYICDGAGSENNDFLGDCRVDCYWDDANGNSSQLVGSDTNSVDNYLQTDDTSPDGDTTYNQSATVGEKDTYGHTDMIHTPLTIFGVQEVMVTKKDDEGSRSICGVCRSGGADYDGSAQALSTSYIGYTQIRETDPATSAAWTKSGFNSAEFGMKIAA